MLRDSFLRLHNNVPYLGFGKYDYMYNLHSVMEPN